MFFQNAARNQDHGLWKIQRLNLLRVHLADPQDLPGSLRIQEHHAS